MAGRPPTFSVRRWHESNRPERGLRVYGTGMALEREIKLKIGDAEETLARCLELGAELVQERLFEDNQILDFEDLRLKREGKLIRLREYGEERSLTFKGPAAVGGRVKTREEIEVEIQSLEPWQLIFQQLGLRPMFRYQKYRRIYRLLEDRLWKAAGTRPAGEGRHLKIMFDETPIGNFLELEGDEDMIVLVAERLGYGPGAFILETYRELFLRECRRQGIAACDMLFQGC